MKPLFLISSFCLLSLKANIALSPSSPLFPEEGLLLAKESFTSFKTGYYLDYVWKMPLKSSHGVNHARLKKTTQLGAIGLCLSDLVDLYGFVGVQKNTLHYKKEEQAYTYKDTFHYSWALYANGILNQWGKLQLGASAFYGSTPSHSGTLYPSDLSPSSATFQQYSWGVSLGFSYDYVPCAPYARIDFQKTKGQLSAITHEHFHVMHPLGLAFGFVSDLTHGLFIDLECRCIQENGVRGLVGLRF